VSLELAVRHRQGEFSLDAAFTASAGVTALFGRSGAGKTTLAWFVAGVSRPDEGRIVLDGDVLVDTAAGLFVPQRRRRIGVVFQEGRLFPHLTVRQNLTFGQRFLPRGETRPDIAPVVDLLGIRPLLDRRPRTLSGGEQQRVAIGRALLTNPRVLVMDEPLASIDRARRAEILPYLDRLKSEMRIPILYISHAIEEIARIADTIVVLAEGRVASVGPAAAMLAEIDLASIDDGETGVILSGTVTSTDTERGHSRVAHPAGTLIVPLLAAPIGTKVRLRVHARDVAIAVGEPGRISIRNRLPARIAAIRPHGGAADVRLDLSGEALLARLTMDAVEDLGLRERLAVTALIKAVAVEGY
jgi:molybdate transport system ATP-binding protein